jgi:hypothetical protein
MVVTVERKQARHHALQRPLPGARVLLRIQRPRDGVFLINRVLPEDLPIELAAVKEHRARGFVVDRYELRAAAAHETHHAPMFFEQLPHVPERIARELQHVTQYAEDTRRGRAWQIQEQHPLLLHRHFVRCRCVARHPGDP